MRRRPGGRSASREGGANAMEGPDFETLASGPAEGLAILGRPLPVLLAHPPVFENQRAFAADRLAAAGSEHDAGAYAYSATAAAGNSDRRVDAPPGIRAVGHPGIHVAAVSELGAARGRSPAQHDLVVRGSVPAARGFADPARGGATGKQNHDQRCDSHKASMETKRPEDFSPGRRPAVRHAGLTAGGNPKSAD